MTLSLAKLVEEKVIVLAAVLVFKALVDKDSLGKKYTSAADDDNLTSVSSKTTP